LLLVFGILAFAVACPHQLSPSAAPSWAIQQHFVVAFIAYRWAYWSTAAFRFAAFIAFGYFYLRRSLPSAGPWSTAVFQFRSSSAAGFCVFGALCLSSSSLFVVPCLLLVILYLRRSSPIVCAGPQRLRSSPSAESAAAFCLALVINDLVGVHCLPLRDRHSIALVISNLVVILALVISDLVVGILCLPLRERHFISFAAFIAFCCGVSFCADRQRHRCPSPSAVSIVSFRRFV